MLPKSLREKSLCEKKKNEHFKFKAKFMSDFFKSLNDLQFFLYLIPWFEMMDFNVKIYKRDLLIEKLLCFKVWLNCEIVFKPLVTSF